MLKNNLIVISNCSNTMCWLDIILKEGGDWDGWEVKNLLLPQEIV